MDTKKLGAMTMFFIITFICSFVRTKALIAFMNVMREEVME